MESLFESVQKKGPAFIVVVLLHVVLAAAIGAQRMEAQKPVPKPMVVDILAAVPEMQERLPPPPVKIERTTPTVIAPELPELAAAQWEIAPAPAAAPVPTRQVAVDETPIVQARFDAEYLKNPTPAYPPISRRMREQGVVVLRVRVQQDGHAAEVAVHRRSGHPRLDEAALSAVKYWRFVPARRGETAVESWVLVPIEFSLNS